MRDGVVGGSLRESEAPASILVAHLVELISADFAAEAERVLTTYYGSIVEELERVVLVLKRPIRAISDSIVVGDGDAGYAPLYRIPAFQSWHPQFSHHISLT